MPEQRTDDGLLEDGLPEPPAGEEGEEGEGGE